MVWTHFCFIMVCAYDSFFRYLKWVELPSLRPTVTLQISFSLETVDIESPQIGHEWKQFYLVTKTTEFVRLLNIFKKRRRYLHNKNTETHCSSHNFYKFPIVRHKYLMFLVGWNCAANFQNWHFFLKSSLVCRFFGELYWTLSPLELEVLYETS